MAAVAVGRTSKKSLAAFGRALKESARVCANHRTSPGWCAVDYGAFVRAWKKEGTQRMGTLKGASSTTCDDDGVDRSEVIRRHLSAGAGTPLYT